MNYCICGCGVEIPIRTKHGDPQRFLKGHHKPRLGKPGLRNEQHPHWKGNDVGYNSLHEWVRNHLPRSELCEICHEIPPRDLANKTGTYDRDLNNWFYLCKKCHNKYDEKGRDPKTGRFIN